MQHCEILNHQVFLDQLRTQRKNEFKKGVQDFFHLSDYFPITSLKYCSSATNPQRIKSQRANTQQGSRVGGNKPYLTSFRKSYRKHCLFGAKWINSVGLNVFEGSCQSLLFLSNPRIHPLVWLICELRRNSLSNLDNFTESMLADDKNNFQHMSCCVLCVLITIFILLSRYEHLGSSEYMQHMFGFSAK
jgi:hypothetical protein